MIPIRAYDAILLLGIAYIDLGRIAKAIPSVKIRRGFYDEEALIAIKNIPEATKEGQKLYKAEFYKRNKTRLNKKCAAYQKERYATDEEYREKRLSLSAANRAEKAKQ